MDATTALAAKLFHGLPRADLEKLARAARIRRLRPREHVWREGDPASCLLVVLSGRLCLSRKDAEGGEYVLRVVEPGEADGEPGMFAEEDIRLTDCSALEPTELLIVEREELLAFLERHPLALRRMLARMSAIVQHHITMLTEIAFRDIAPRLARVLLDLGRTRGKPVVGGTQLPPALSQRVLAGLIAASRENVNRALARFEELGAVVRRVGAVIITDTFQLQRIADDDPPVLRRPALRRAKLTTPRSRPRIPSRTSAGRRRRS